MSLLTRVEKIEYGYIRQRVATPWTCLPVCVCTHASIAWCLSLVTLPMPAKLRHRDRRCFFRRLPTIFVCPEILIHYFRGKYSYKLEQTHVPRVGSSCRSQVFDLFSFRLLTMITTCYKCHLASVPHRTSYFQFVIHSKYCINLINLLWWLDIRDMYVKTELSNM